MTASTASHVDAETVTVRVPLTFRRRGGRKTISYPPGVAPLILRKPKPAGGPLVKALGRAFRWRKLIESGAYATIQEIADAENINPSYVARVIRLTLLAPEIVEAILDGRNPDTTLDNLLKPFPLDWKAQAHRFFSSGMIFEGHARGDYAAYRSA